MRCKVPNFVYIFAVRNYPLSETNNNEKNKNTSITTMKETINVNIGSQSFTLDYDAYQTLRTYLEDIESRLSDDDKEVMIDIENRIAEIFRENTPSPMMVVTLATVRKAMAQMGRPEEFGERRVREERKSKRDQTQRLFRRPLNDRVIGGVCAGIAQFFNIDTVVVRLLMFLLVFFGTVSLWVYIILWIVMPSDEPKKFNNTNR